MMPFPFDLQAFIATLGAFGVAGVVFFESGIPLLFFLPGDSLLFTTGLLASHDYVSLPLLLVILPIAAVLGDIVGYWFGMIAGKSLIERPRFFIRPRHIRETEEFFMRHGSRAVILARFVPIIRTFVPLFAGVGSMRFPLFLRYDIIGGVLWTYLVTLGGYYLGSVLPQSEQYIFPLSIGIILLSLIPVAIGLRNGNGTHEPQGQR